MGTLEVEEEHVLLPPPSLTVLVGVNGSKRSKYAVKWALENFSADGRILFRLLHVCPRIKAVPTPMGNIPISQVRPDVAVAYKEEMEWRTNRILLPYKRLQTNKKDEVEIVVIEEDDVPQAISREVSVFNIHKLVIGASSRGWFTRKFKGQDLSSRISECVPSFCTVYVISKGTMTVHPSTSVANRSVKDKSGDTSSSTNIGFSYNSRSQTEIQQFQALPTINENLLFRRSSSTSDGLSRSAFIDTKNQTGTMNSSLNNSGVQRAGSRFSSSRSLCVDCQSWDSDQVSTSDASSVSSSSESQMCEDMKPFCNKVHPLFEESEKTSDDKIAESNAGGATQGELAVDGDGSDLPTHVTQVDENVGYHFLEGTNTQTYPRIPTSDRRDVKSGTPFVQSNHPFSISKCVEVLFSIPNVSKETCMKALKFIRTDPTWRETFMSVSHEIKLEMLAPSQLDEQ